MTATYDSWLVVLSVVVATLASYAALTLASRVAHAPSRASVLWLLGGSVVMGTAIWSMHFIGMLAFRLPIPLGYDIGLTMLSGAAAVAVSALALYATSRPQLRLVHWLSGGVAMGLGICTMHYTGMQALRMRPAIEYDPYWFSASVAIAIAASLAALAIVSALSRSPGEHKPGRMLLASLTMGLAISGMHYSGMAAARFADGSRCLAAGVLSLDQGWLAVVVGVVTAGLVVVAVVASLLDARLQQRTSRLTGLLDNANGALLHLAMHDPLTQLPNRLQFELRLREVLDRSAAQNERLAVLFVDLDGFKPINDALGHPAGDEMLRIVAARIGEYLPRHGFAARIGGDEFVLLLERAGSDAEIGRFAEGLIEHLAEPALLGEEEVQVSASVGIALMPDHDTGAALLRKADLAMYQAKRGGRGTWRMYAPDCDIAAHNVIEMARDLRHALERGELALYYQPKIDALDGSLAGVEALLRWHSPTRGIVPTDDFIPLAERFGLIVPIGVWTLHEACRQACAWMRQGLRIPVSVNLSPLQFRDPGLLDTITGALARFQLEPGLLVVEITEASAIDNPEVAQATVRGLAACGVRVSIDDFGTGHSSLSRMQHMEVSELKLDRSFLQGIEHEASTRAIVEAIARLTRSLSLKLVAEGVETLEQAQLLRELGCDMLQGFYYSKAVQAEEIPHLASALPPHQRAAA